MSVCMYICRTAALYVVSKLHYTEGLWFDVCWYLPPYTNKDPGSLRPRKQKLGSVWLYP